MTTNNSRYQRSINAMGAIRSEDDRWEFADALHDEVAPGDPLEEFQRIREEALEQGIKAYKVGTMRQYRDTARRWPKDKRVKGVKFSAHRAALGADDPKGLLESLQKVNGDDGVTVKNVQDALSASKASSTSTPTSPSTDLNKASAADLISYLVKKSETEAARAVVQVDQKNAKSRIAWLENLVTEAKTLQRRTYNSPLAAASKKKQAEPVEEVSSDDTKSNTKKGDIRGL